MPDVRSIITHLFVNARALMRSVSWIVLTALFAPVTIGVATASSASASSYPTVSITSPASGSTVEGTVSVSVSAATDPSQSDYPNFIDVYADSNSIARVYCTYGDSTCSGSVNWDTTGLSGQHTLVAELTTYNSVTATSATVTVNVYSGTRIKLTSVSSATSGHQEVVHGVISALSSHLAAPGVSLSVRYSPRTGASWSGTVKSGTAGDFSIRFTPVVNGVLHLTSVASSGYGASSMAVHVSVHATALCNLSSRHLVVGSVAVSRCEVKYLPSDTAFKVQLLSRPGGWITLFTSWSSTRGSIAFHVSALRTGSYRLRVVLLRNSAFAQTITSLGTLNVT